MSLDTLARVISSAYLGLGSPEAELLQEGELAEVAIGEVEYFYEGVRQSDQNLMIKRTAEFTLAAGANSKDLTALASDIITPLWVERKIIDSANDTWQFVETVNLDSLTDRRLQSIVAVSFYGNLTTQITAEFSYYGDDLSSSIYRVVYSPSVVLTTDKDAALAFPSNLQRLIVVCTKINAVPLIIINASKYVEKRPELSARMTALQNAIPLWMTQKEEWMKLYVGWKNASRGSHKARNRPDVLRSLRSDNNYRGYR